MTGLVITDWPLTDCWVDESERVWAGGVGWKTGRVWSEPVESQRLSCAAELRGLASYQQQCRHGESAVCWSNFTTHSWLWDKVTAVAKELQQLWCKCAIAAYYQCWAPGKWLISEIDLDMGSINWRQSVEKDYCNTLRWQCFASCIKINLVIYLRLCQIEEDLFLCFCAYELYKFDLIYSNWFHWSPSKRESRYRGFKAEG